MSCKAKPTLDGRLSRIKFSTKLTATITQTGS
jgi:hypothetical protein